MLKILWGVTEDCYYYLDREFEYVQEKDWFEDPLIKEILLDIDHCTSDGVVCRDVRFGHTFPISGLSTGSKGLMILAKMDYDFIHVWGPAFGDNCAKWLLKIAESRNFTLDMEHFMNFPEQNFKAYSCHARAKYSCYQDFVDEVLQNFPSNVFTYNDPAKIEVEISNRKIKYNLTFPNRVNFIIGDSGSGKSTFVKLCEDYSVGIKSTKASFLLDGLPVDRTRVEVFDSRRNLPTYELSFKKEHCIFIIDGFCTICQQPEFWEWIQKSDNYFILLTRKVPTGLNAAAFILRSDDTEANQLAQYF